MAEQICSYCRAPCGTRNESGKFTADGPIGDIIGNRGDDEVSDCCGEPIEEIKDGD